MKYILTQENGKTSCELHFNTGKVVELNNKEYTEFENKCKEFELVGRLKELNNR